MTALAGRRVPGALDPLVWDRDFLRELYDFDYVWEVYVPAAKRRWGYYVLPILFGDRLVGRIEPRIERTTDTLRVAGLWWEDGFDPLAEPGFVEAFAAAFDAHRAFGGVATGGWPRTWRATGRAVGTATVRAAAAARAEAGRQRRSGGRRPVVRPRCRHCRFLSQARDPELVAWPSADHERRRP